MVVSLEISISVILLFFYGSFVLCDEVADGSGLPPLPNVVCQASQFACADGLKCISKILECDSLPDCDDGSDEAGHCEIFTCGDGITFNTRFVCDGFDDCADGSDESESEANCTKFQCADGKKIAQNLVCDEFDDCDDTFRSDECDCEGRFTCANKKCISSQFKCDEVDDCEDGSDEIGCNVFICYNGAAVNSSLKCNGADDCGDTSDECGCANSFSCTNGRCINENLKGDGNDDCGDNTDELFDVTSMEPETGNGVSAATQQIPSFTTLSIIETETTTKETASGDDGSTSEYFTCAGGQSIDASLVCDGTDDCRDGYRSDECSCSWSFNCDNTKCIDSDLACDGVDDCGDCSDEMTCFVPGSDWKTYNMFVCHKGSCIRDAKLCDGYKDCPSGDDEFDCDEDDDVITENATTAHTTTTTTKGGVDVTTFEKILTEGPRPEVIDGDFGTTAADEAEDVDITSEFEEGEEADKTGTTREEIETIESTVGVTAAATIPSRFTSVKPESTTSVKADSQGGPGGDAMQVTSRITLYITLFAIYFAPNIIP